METLAERFIDNEVLNAQKVRLMVLAVGPMDVNDSRRNPVVVEEWSPLDAVIDVWRNGLNVRTRTYLRRKTPLRYSNILEYLRRGQLRTQLRDAVLSLSGQLSRSTGGNSRGSESNDTLGNVETRQAGTAKRLSEVPPPANPATLQNFRVGGAQLSALKRLQDRLRSVGVELVVVHTPVSDWFSRVYSGDLWSQYLTFLTTVRDELDMPVMLLDKQSYGLEESDYFEKEGGFDGHHVLSDGGRKGFAQGLRVEVIRPLYERLKAGERLGGALSRFEVRRP